MSEKVVPGVPPRSGEDLQALFDAFQHVCDTLEVGGLSLDESLTLYARGRELELRIQRELGRAERRVVEILKPDGTTEPFVVAEGRRGSASGPTEGKKP